MVSIQHSIEKCYNSLHGNDIYNLLNIWQFKIGYKQGAKLRKIYFVISVKPNRV